MEQKSVVINLSQNERYCSKCKKVNNEKEFDNAFSSIDPKSIENTTSIKQSLCQQKQSLCKECVNIKKKHTNRFISK